MCAVCSVPRSLLVPAVKTAQDQLYVDDFGKQVTSAQAKTPSCTLEPPVTISFV
jgi:hypothetical protein